jgi:hypothetical protein
MYNRDTDNITLLKQYTNEKPVMYKNTARVDGKSW